MKIQISHYQTKPLYNSSTSIFDSYPEENNIELLIEKHILQKYYQANAQSNDSTKTQQKQSDEVISINFEDQERYQEDLSIFQEISQFTGRIFFSIFYKKFFFFMLLVYAVATLLWNHDRSTMMYKISYYMELAAQCFFIFGIFIRLISRQEIHYIWCTIQFFSTLCGMLGLLLEPQTAKYFKAVACLRLLVFIKITSLITPAKKIIKSLDNIGKIIIPAFFFIYLFSMVGLYAFSKNQYSRCKSSLSQSSYQRYLCGEKTCPVVQGTQLVCLNSIFQGLPANSSQLQSPDFGYGLQKYENILFSFFQTFIRTFGTSSTAMLILQKQALNGVFVTIYFISFLFLLNMFYVNIYSGLIIANEQSGSEAQDKIIEYKNKIKHLQNDQQNQLNQNNRQNISIKTISSGSNEMVDKQIEVMKAKRNQRQVLQRYSRNSKIVGGGSDLIQFSCVLPKQRGHRNAILNLDNLDYKEPKNEQKEINVQIIPKRIQQKIQNHKSKFSKKTKKFKLKTQKTVKTSKTIQIKEQIDQKPIMDDISYHQIQNSANEMIQKRFQNYELTKSNMRKAFSLISYENSEDKRSQRNSKTNKRFKNGFNQNSSQIQKTIHFKTQQVKEFQDQEVFAIKPNKQAQDQLEQAENKQNYQTQSKQNSKDYIQDQQFDINYIISTVIATKGRIHAFTIVNNIFILSTLASLLIRYKDQSIQSLYILAIIETICFAQYFFYLLWRIFDTYYITYMVSSKHLRLKLQITIFVIVFFGYIYDAIYQQKNQIPIATDHVSALLRSFLYFRVILMLATCQIFLQIRLMILATLKTTFRILPLFLVFIISVIFLSASSYRLFSLQKDTSYSVSTSYSSLFQSIYLTILCVSNQSWHQTMYEHYQIHGVFVIFWYLLLFFIGYGVISTYFMAVVMNELSQQLTQNQINMIIGEYNGKVVQGKLRKTQKSIKMSQSTNFYKDQQVSNDKSSINNEKQHIQNESNIDFKKQYKMSEINEVQNKSITHVNFETKNWQQITIWQSPILKIINFRNSTIYRSVKALIIAITLIDMAIRSPQWNEDNQINSYLQKLSLGTHIFFFADLALFYVLHMNSKTFEQCNKKFNKFDYFNTVITLINALQLLELDSGGYLKFVKTIKIFRIIFFLAIRCSTDRTMGLTMSSLLRLIPKVCQVLVISFSFSSFFSIILTNLYKDQQSYCTNFYSNISVSSEKDCLNWGGDWVDYGLNFSSFWQSSLFIFYIGTSGGWSQFIDEQSTSVTKTYLIKTFAIIYYILGNMILFNIIIGISADTFKKLKQQQTGECDLEKAERGWLRIKHDIYSMDPEAYEKAPTGFIRKLFFKYSSGLINKIIKSCMYISLVVVVSLYSSFISNQMELYYHGFLLGFSYIQQCIYLIEVVSFGLKTPKQLKIFIFKMAFLLYAIVYAILYFNFKSVIGISNQKILGSILIVGLIVQLLQFLFEFQYFEKLFNSLTIILPQTINILMLISAIVLIYTFVGMQLFSYLKYGDYFNDFDINYNNFPQALYSTLSILFNQGLINQYLDAKQQLAPDFVCFDITTFTQFKLHGQNGCGDQITAFFYFISLQFIVNILLMSALIGFIFDIYSKVNQEEEGIINKFEIYQVRNQWKKFDINATGKINYRQFWLFTTKLLNIFHFRSDQFSSRQKKQELLKDLCVPIFQNSNQVLCFEFYTTVECFCRTIAKKRNPQMKFSKADKLFQQKQQHRVSYEKTKYNSSQISAFFDIKNGLRNWKRRCCRDQSSYKFQSFQIRVQKFIENINYKLQQLSSQ